MHKSNFLFLLLFLGSVYITFAQLSTQHYIPPLTSAEFENANPDGQATSASFYSGFVLSPEISIESNATTLGNCIPNLTLESVNTNLFDFIKWFCDDGTGFVRTRNTYKVLTPNFWYIFNKKILYFCEKSHT